MHKTKSGEVPTPDRVYDANTSAMVFHDREVEKGIAFELEGDARTAELEAVLLRQEQNEADLAESTAALEAARAALAEANAAELEQLDATFDELKTKQRAHQKDGKSEIAVFADTLAVGDQADSLPCSTASQTIKKLTAVHVLRVTKRRKPSKPCKKTPLARSKVWQSRSANWPMKSNLTSLIAILEKATRKCASSASKQASQN